ncbi:MAG: FAD-dependent thymidylate synthase [Nanoarchaeota archaeon]|nr:FAD-dependent thymidylate synthase [Nanoarchaeota archaeon]
MTTDFSIKPKVELMGCVLSPDYPELGSDEIAAYGAFGCFKEDSSLELFLKDLEKYGPDFEEATRGKIEKVMDESAGRGHGSVLDQSKFIFSIEGVPRITTLQLCLPQYADHLQQSLRRASADRGFYLPVSIVLLDNADVLEVIEKIENVFGLYEEMKEGGVPVEDARNVLPLYTRTNIQSGGDARELMHMDHMGRQPYTADISRFVSEAIMLEGARVAPSLLKERASNYEPLAWYPSSQLFAFKNSTLDDVISEFGTDQAVLLENSGINLTEEGIRKAVIERDEAEMANLKHTHFTFLVPFSLSAFHQATRQRTWDQSVESLYSALERTKMVVPPSVGRTGFAIKYGEANLELVNLYHKLVSKGVPPPDALGVLPHSLMVYDLLHVNGWNAIHSIGKRTCTEAQWEIRDRANEMAEAIRVENPILGEYAVPQGKIYGKCPERNPCGLCDKVEE